MENIEKGLIDFINKTPNAFYCVENIKTVLLENGFVELYENNIWDNISSEGKYFVIKNDSSLIAFKTTNCQNFGFNIVATHGDSPSFSVKPNADIFDGNYLKINTNPYGGVINYTWFDRPLSIAGRVISYKDGVCKKHLVNIDKDLLVIPSVAIHLNRSVNENATFNQQTDMLPIVSLSNQKKLADIIIENLSQNYFTTNDICDYDLYLYSRDKAKFLGADSEFILSPRLDDLACVYPAFRSFVEADNKNSINVFCVFNNEEIGSLTMQGADSTFLFDTLSRISKAMNFDLQVALSNSVVISADNAHAIHPNAQAKSDPSNTVRLNGGVVVKRHTNYATDAVSASIMKGICNQAGVPYQDFACRSDLKCGSTLGGISQSHVSVDCVDIGLAQLAMHSTNEVIGAKDVDNMYKALLKFYNSKIFKSGDEITIV